MKKEKKETENSKIKEMREKEFQKRQSRERDIKKEQKNNTETKTGAE
ncbi:MAG: hypothetical protein ACXVCE_11810 [Bacteriovorax sp.]